MNHNQDIDDGLEEYQENEEHLGDEQIYTSNPLLFSQEIKGVSFVGMNVETIHLTGIKTGSMGHPFDYTTGVAVVWGMYGGQLCRMRLEWKDNGDDCYVAVGTDA